MFRNTLLALGVVLFVVSVSQAQSFTEGFETGPPIFTGPSFGVNGPPGDALALASGNWFALNNSVPIGVIGVFQSNLLVTPFGSFHAAMNFNNGGGLATINTFLMSPTVTFNNGDTISFFTRTVDTPAFPDRMELQVSLNGSSTNAADFTTTLITINPTLTTAGYPNVWTQFTGTISGLGGPTSGRFAFHYDVPGGGPSGANSDFIGIDNVVYTSNSVVPEPTTMALMGIGGLGLAVVCRRAKKFRASWTANQAV